MDLGIQDRTGPIVAASIDPQSGGDGHVPFEVGVYTVLVDGEYGVVVEHAGGSVPDWVQLMVWRVESIEHYTKNGSVTNTSESTNPGMLAVGAAHWNDVRAIEYYSGRGPTPDGRVKPDIVGADCGETALRHLDEYNEGFCGTSQSAPHMAGLAALVRQRFPEYTPAQIASYLKDNAAQRQMPDPNNTWGHGFAKLPPPDGSAPRLPAPSNAFVRNPAGDFDTLIRAFNWVPQGIWSDGTTMWVADWLNAKLYAYDAVTKARVPGRDFDTLTAAGNTWPGGIWSDGTTMWVADWLDQEIYAYDMASKARVSGKEFNTLEAAGNALPQGIWSDGTTMWVVDLTDEKIYAYDMETRARVPRQDYDTLRAAGNTWPGGIWSDGTTMWVADSNTEKIYAYDMASKARVSGKEFNSVEAAGNWGPQGIWSDGTTMWVVDREDGKIYAYFMPKESAADKEALIAFYNATGGVSWTNNANWLTSSPIGQWHGVTTDDDGRVTHLALSQNQLSGEIPTELGSLANLEELYLWGNQLTGEIPAELGDLANLEELYLSDNQLSGEIPTELGGLANLEALDLWDNQLSGEIPSELRNLANLTVLSLSQNQLTGPVPTWLGSLANLEKLYLSDNQLTGEIPQSLTGLAALTRFYFINNPGLCAPVDEAFQTWLRSIALVRGSSCAPVDSRDDRAVLVELYNSTGGENWNESANWLSDRPIREWHGVTNDANGRVNGLYLVRNQLAGEIPSELGGLSNLEVLLLNDNRLTGTIPTELGGLSNLLWGRPLRQPTDRMHPPWIAERAV